jgi:hypothetical protein
MERAADAAAAGGALLLAAPPAPADAAADAAAAPADAAAPAPADAAAPADSPAAAAAAAGGGAGGGSAGGDGRPAASGAATGGAGDGGAGAAASAASGGAAASSWSVPVPAQTDPEYSSTASNQCSWAAAEFLLKGSELRHSFHKKPEEFVRIYKECLERASQLRAAAGKKHLYGENVDTPELLGHYAGKFHITDRITIKMNASGEFLDVLHPDLKREFYTREYNLRPLSAVLAGVFGPQGALVSRHGQSLAVIPYFGRFLICDSHLHHAMVVSREAAFKHILMDEGGHRHLTVILAAC